MMAAGESKGQAANKHGKQQKQLRRGRDHGGLGLGTVLNLEGR